MYIKKQRKVNRILNNGLSVCIAIDHGLMSDPTNNVTNIESILKSVIKGGADGILISPGQLENYRDLFNVPNSPAIILRVDWMNALRLGKVNDKNAVPSKQLMHTSIVSIEKAVEYGADAVVAYYVLGYNKELELQTLINCTNIAKECHRHGIVFIMEPMIIKGNVNGSYDAMILADAARISQEIGADMLKIPYTGDETTFRYLAKDIHIPILVLGGASSKKKEDSFTIISEAINAGASGLIFGRKVTCDKNPEELVGNIVNFIHGNQKIEEFIKINNDNFRLKFDSSKCTGCRMCISICAYSNGGNKLFTTKDEFNYNVFVCDKCGVCEKNCPSKSIKIGKRIEILETCILCGKCVELCPQGILKIENNQISYCSYCDGIECKCETWCPENALTRETI